MSIQTHICDGCQTNRISNFFALCKPCEQLLIANKLRHVAQHFQDYWQHSFSSLSNTKFLKKERYKREAVEALRRLRSGEEQIQEID